MELSVSNSGSTLPASQLERLFEPLQRERSGNDKVERSSLGLGLYIVKAIASAHGAKLSVSSADGVTVFVVTWPKD